MRPLCARCLRPGSACICHWIRPVANEIELLLLQHPLEQHEAKGSAGLLRLSLARSRLLVGERFDPTALGPLEGALLLYPPDPSEARAEPPAQARPAQAAQPGRPRQLIVLDATWRKSRKILLLNPFLRTLPRMALSEPPASRYAALRKAPGADRLSTLEASVLALQRLEGRPERYTPLLDAFAGFVAEACARRQGR
jgi:DTW domain-containing protein